MTLRIDMEYTKPGVKNNNADYSVSILISHWRYNIELKTSTNLPSGFDAVAAEILERVDHENAFFGTVNELSNFSGESTYIVRKTLALLHKRGYVFRRKGIVLVNPYAFNSSTLRKIKKEDFM